MQKVKKIQVIINPAASYNAGKRVWAGLAPHFKELFTGYECLVAEPESREQSTEIAKTTDADMIISVSGDGAIHNIAQGIMHRPREHRPALAVVPIGSGNDFAKSLGIPSDPLKALRAIATGRRVTVDVGSCNGTIYMETLSFGIDAAIANGTMEKRKTTKQRGLMLYANVAVSSIVRDLRKHHFVITLEDGSVIDDELLICAIQNGPSYGGGFKVAPKALINDGLLNVCMATNTNKVFALFALVLLSKGKHEGLSIFNTLTAKSLTIDLDEDIPVQCDGEEIFGRHFDIKVLPRAVDVIVGQCSSLVEDTASAGVGECEGDAGVVAADAAGAGVSAVGGEATSGRDVADAAGAGESKDESASANANASANASANANDSTNRMSVSDAASDTEAA